MAVILKILEGLSSSLVWLTQSNTNSCVSVYPIDHNLEIIGRSELVGKVILAVSGFGFHFAQLY